MEKPKEKESFLPTHKLPTLNWLALYVSIITGKCCTQSLKYMGLTSKSYLTNENYDEFEGREIQDDEYSFVR